MLYLIFNKSKSIKKQYENESLDNETMHDMMPSNVAEKKFVRQYKLKQKEHKKHQQKHSYIKPEERDSEDSPNELLEGMERIKNITNHPENYAKKSINKKFETTGLPPEAFRMVQKSHSEEGEGADVNEKHAEKYYVDPEKDIKKEAQIPNKLPSQQMSTIKKDLPLNSSGQIDRSTFFNAFSHHGLNKYEISEVFDLADINKTGSLSKEEWRNFYSIFVDDFQGVCNEDGDWQLTPSELAKCMQTAHWVRYFAPMGAWDISTKSFGPNEGEEKTNRNFAEDIVYAADKGGDGKLNFLEYLYLRKASVAWYKCVQERLITRTDVRCALIIAGNGRVMDGGEADFIQRTGLELSNADWSYRGWNFPTLVLIADAYRTWSYMEKGQINGSITIRELREATKRQWLPQIITPAVVEQFLKVVKSDSITFPEQLNLIYQQKLFDTYARQDHLIQLDEFLGLLHDRIIPWHMRMSMDQIFMKIPKKQYLPEKEVDVPLANAPTKLNLRDVDFLEGHKFIQLNNKVQNKIFPTQSYVNNVIGGVNDRVNKWQPNKPSIYPQQKMKKLEHKQRGVIYQIVDLNFDGTVDFYEFFKFIQMQKLFHYLGGGVENLQPWYLDINTMSKRFDSIGNWSAYAIPLPSGLKDDLIIISKMCKNRQLDLRHFLTLTNGEESMERYQTRNSGVSLPVQKVLILLNQFSYNQPELIFQGLEANPIGYNMKKIYYKAIELDSSAMFRYNNKIGQLNMIKDLKKVKWDDAHSKDELPKEED